MDTNVIKIVDDEEDHLLDKLVDIVDSLDLDREIDLTWALIGLVETVNRENVASPTAAVYWPLQTAWSMGCLPFDRLLTTAPRFTSEP